MGEEDGEVAPSQAGGLEGEIEAVPSLSVETGLPPMPGRDARGVMVVPRPTRKTRRSFGGRIHEGRGADSTAPTNRG